MGISLVIESVAPDSYGLITGVLTESHMAPH